MREALSPEHVALPSSRRTRVAAKYILYLVTLRILGTLGLHEFSYPRPHAKYTGSHDVQKGLGPFMITFEYELGYHTTPVARESKKKPESPSPSPREAMLKPFVPVTVD